MAPVVPYRVIAQYPRAASVPASWRRISSEQDVSEAEARRVCGAGSACQVNLVKLIISLVPRLRGRVSSSIRRRSPRQGTSQEEITCRRSGWRGWRRGSGCAPSTRPLAGSENKTHLVALASQDCNLNVESLLPVVLT